ncbi:hypothetical protein B0H13DRAFT_2310359 [Mycena leptocephala]|nr:hypothetical protein B0H13DRAFT_2310359 [Mycena leptocephala]
MGGREAAVESDVARLAARQAPTTAPRPSSFHRLAPPAASRSKSSGAPPPFCGSPLPAFSALTLRLRLALLLLSSSQRNATALRPRVQGSRSNGRHSERLETPPSAHTAYAFTVNVERVRERGRGRRRPGASERQRR